ncbi:MAG TPA: LptF/LptG family permease [Phycisphaerae bacterium]|jgi:lipopolysaccharide export LptBFGC system permease protein LptF|nr:LptF/LptG family permease [Phycisphaerae bacterium]
MFYYKTLHWYIFRELLRIFFLTASALTTLLAFGGMFKPFTKQGVDVSQLLVIMMNLMPAMLAYAIPIAALFAAVLVYWRIATDNEITACRAGGISFIAIVIPAFVLGGIVAATDWGFVNYVVPHFLEATERAIRRDSGALLVSQISRQEKFEYNNFVIYADKAYQQPTDQPDTSRVVLQGMAAAQLKNGKPAYLVIAQQAVATLRDKPDAGSTDVLCELSNAAAFEPNTFQKLTGSVDVFPLDGRPVTIPSLLRAKPKYYNRRALLDLLRDPYPFPDVAKYLSDIGDRFTDEVVAERLYNAWRDNASNGARPLEFNAASIASDAITHYRLYAPAAALSPDRVLTFAATAKAPVRLEQYEKNVLQSTYTSDAADLMLTQDPFIDTGTSAKLQLRGNVMRRDNVLKIGPNATGTVVISNIQLPPAIRDVSLPPPRQLLDSAASSGSPVLTGLQTRAQDAIAALTRTISSEFNSRGSFSLSCLTLVLLGAALGIQLRGRNPLAVFVVGFVPAIILVLLITAGQQLAESSNNHVAAGTTLIWAGNILLLALVSAVYAVLLRH